MKTKIIVVTLALLMLTAGIVSAASIWGTYKGNDVIRLTMNGKAVNVSDVPVISYNNRTMIPIYLLQQAGVKYTWDQKNKTVDITPQNNSTTKVVGLDWKTIYNHLKKYNVYALSIGIMDNLDAITADYNGLHTEITNTQYNEILKTLAYSDASYFQIYFIDGSSYSYTSQTVRNFYEGKITEKQLNDSITVDIKGNNQTNVPSSTTITSKIDGDFNGFQYGNVFVLQNGQIWKQTSFEIKVAYKYNPKVTIYKDGIYYYMMVDGVDKQVKVELIS